MNFFVGESCKNNHMFKDPKEERKSRIENYAATPMFDKCDTIEECFYFTWNLLLACFISLLFCLSIDLKNLLIENLTE